MEDLIIKEREFKENLVKTVNESKLPAFIMKSVLKEMLEQINLLEIQQYNQAVEIKASDHKKKGAKNEKN